MAGRKLEGFRNLTSKYAGRCTVCGGEGFHDETIDKPNELGYRNVMVCKHCGAAKGENAQVTGGIEQRGSDSKSGSPRGGT